MTDRINVLIVDESRLNPYALQAAVAGNEEVVLTGIAENLTEALEQAGDCDVVLVNVVGRWRRAQRLVHALHRKYAMLRILVVGIDDTTDEAIADLLTYVEAGATGYIATGETAEELMAKVLAASRSEAIISPRVAARLMQRLTQIRNELPDPPVGTTQVWRLSSLSPREREVLQLLAGGLSNRDIAMGLDIHEGTVRAHVHRILTKLGVDSRREAGAIYRMKLQHASD